MAPTSGVTREGRESVCATTRGLPEEIGRIQTSSALYFIFLSRPWGKTNAAFLEGLLSGLVWVLSPTVLCLCLGGTPPESSKQSLPLLTLCEQFLFPDGEAEAGPRSCLCSKQGHGDLGQPRLARPRDLAGALRTGLSSLSLRPVGSGE